MKGDGTVHFLPQMVPLLLPEGPQQDLPYFTLDIICTCCCCQLLSSSLKVIAAAFKCESQSSHWYLRKYLMQVINVWQDLEMKVLHIFYGIFHWVIMFYANINYNKIYNFTYCKTFATVTCAVVFINYLQSTPNPL